MPDSNVDSIRTRIALIESELLDLKQQLANAERVAVRPDTDATVRPGNQSIQGTPVSQASLIWTWPLDAEEYVRYGRQMIMPEIGLQGQLNLRNSSALVIGVGGLGCPAAQYLVAAGVGTIGLVDGDRVELSNLHRQILHSTERVGQQKVESAIKTLRQLNPKVRYVPYAEHLTPATALAIFKDYDLVLDCTDHPASRYLVSDASILSGKPFISGSALRTEGQLMVLNHPPCDLQKEYSGPCYRCIFPNPPPAEAVISCGEGGILGPVVGVIGVLMALKAIQILTEKVECGLNENPPINSPATMLIFSAYGHPPFRQVRLCAKRKNCVACSSSRTITPDFLTSESFDYETFCGATSAEMILTSEERIEAGKFNDILNTSDKPHFILDVRDETQFGLCSLPGAINVPISVIEAMSNTGRNTYLGKQSDGLVNNFTTSLKNVSEDTPIYTFCRFGNDSQLAVRKLKELGHNNNGARWIGDVKGGYRAWKKEADPHWPEY